MLTDLLSIYTDMLSYQYAFVDSSDVPTHIPQVLLQCQLGNQSNDRPISIEYI